MIQLDWKPPTITNMTIHQLREVFQLTITLQYTSPTIWRTLLVDSRCSLPALHDIIQTVMGWTNSHLHQFTTETGCFGVPDDEFTNNSKNENLYRLYHLINRPDQSFLYEYGFDDGWAHTITLDKILPFSHATILPAVIGGEGACPPEHCGGPWAYSYLLTIIKDPKHPEYQRARECLSNEISVSIFDKIKTNFFLRECIKS